MKQNHISLFLFFSFIFSFNLQASISDYWSSSLRFTSYNIRNFDYDERSNTKTDKNHLDTILNTAPADLFAVQEINKTNVFKEFVKNRLSGYETIFTDCGGAHDQRVGFVYDTGKLRLDSFFEDHRVSLVSNPCGNGSRPAAIGVFKIIDPSNSFYGQKFVALSLHLKAGNRPRSIQKRERQHKIISKIIKEFKALGYENFVLMGDLNTTDYVLGNQNYDHFINFTKNNDLFDAATEVDCTAYWWGGVQDGLEYASILDHILISNSFFNRANDYNVEVQGHCQHVSCLSSTPNDLGKSFQDVSDHCPLVTDLLR